MADQNITVQVNQLELLSPVIAASLVNAILTNELIRLQGGAEVHIDDLKASMASIIHLWEGLTKAVHGAAETSQERHSPPNPD